MSSYQHVITLSTIADGTYETPFFDQNHNKSDFRIAFYDVSNNIVTPSAGAISVSMSIMPGQWVAPSSGDANISAADCGGNATYVRPVFNVSAIKGRIVLSGVAGTGITKVVAIFTVGM